MNKTKYFKKLILNFLTKIDKFPQFSAFYLNFSVNGKCIKRYKTLKDNSFQSNDIININIEEENNIIYLFY